MSEVKSSNQSAYETVERISRTYRSARPNPAENPAWANCHMDCGILLAEIERLTREREQLIARCEAMTISFERLRCLERLAAAGGRDPK